MRYGAITFLMIIVEMHIGIACASLPYLRFLFRFVSANYRSGSAFGITEVATKADKSSPNNRQHPFVELEGGSGGGILKKTEIKMSTFEEELSEEDLPAKIYGGRSPGKADQMQTAWSEDETWPASHSGRHTPPIVGSEQSARREATTL